MSKGWHILREEGALTLARHLPVRFDFAVTATLGDGDPAKLAHQIRQDLWRALQRVRGFSPVIRLEPLPGGWSVTAGGRTPRPLADTERARAKAVLDSARNRARWARFACNTGRMG